MGSYDNHPRPELVSFDDVDYDSFEQVELARSSMLREQYIRNEELKVARDALSKCKMYHGADAQKNCRPLILKFMKMIETHPVTGYLGYQRNDPSQ